MIVAAALVGALQMLAGSPEIILFTWLLLVPVVVGAGGMACLRLTVVALIVAGLAAAQLLPFLDLLAHSQRDEHFATGLWALPLHGWANFFAPLFHTHPSYHGVFAPAGQGWTSSYYVGLTTLALAALAVARVRSARVWWLALAAAGGLALAFGDAAGIYGWARHHLPGLGWMRYPVKFIVLPVVALPLLAAFALAEKPADAGKKLPRRLMILWLAVAAIVAVILWFAHQHPLPDDVWPATLHNGLARIAWLAATLAVIYFATKIQRPSLRALAQAALLLLVWLDLQTHTPRQQTVARDIYEPDLPRSLAAPHFGEGRVMTAPAAAAELNHSFIADPAKDYVSRRWTLLQNCNLLEAAPKVDGFFSLHVREEIEAGALLLGDTNGYPAPLADFLGVKLVTAPTNLFDWTPRATALLLVTTGQKPVFADAATTLARLAAPDFQPAAEVFLPPEARSLISATNLTLAKISNAKFAAQKITFETEASGPALVVVAQSYYHWWRAEVDGQPARLWRANHAYQALEVPAGRHRVTFVYADSSFRIGAAISLATLLGCGVAVIRRRKFFDLG